MFTKILDDSAGIQETILAVSRFMKRFRESARITAGRHRGKVVRRASMGPEQPRRLTK